MLKRDELANPKSCLNKAKDDEYLFVILQRDPAGPGTVAHWVAERIRLGLNTMTDPQLTSAINCIPMMGSVEAPTGPGWWQVIHPTDGCTAFVNVVEVESGPLHAPDKKELRVGVVGEQNLLGIDDLRFRGCRWSKR